MKCQLRQQRDFYYKILSAAKRKEKTMRLLGTNLDTNNPQDAEQIRIALRTGLMTREELEGFQHALSILPQLNDFEQELTDLIKVVDAALADVETVYEQANQNGSIWSMGRIFAYDQYINQHMIFSSQPEAPSAGYADYVYAQRAVETSEEERNNSIGDCEVATLERLYTFIWSQNLLAQRPTLLHIILSGSMGPCKGCRGRIQHFINDLDQKVKELGIRVALKLDVNYTTPTNWENREQYGYIQDQTIVVGRPVEYRYWSRSFTQSLG
jgi:hypothetical protein